MKRLDAWLDRNLPYVVALVIGAALAWGWRVERVMDFVEGKKKPARGARGLKN